MLSRFFREYIFNLIIGIGVVATVTAWGLIGRYWSKPNAIVGAILLASGTIYLMDRLGLGPSPKSKVRNWLDRSGYGIQTIQDTNEFHFVMTDNIGMKTDIIFTKDQPIMIVSGHHRATPQQLAHFNSLSPDGQAAFWKNVRMELLRYGICFSTLTLAGEGVALSDFVPFNRMLTESEFLKRVLFVRSGTRLYYELLSVLQPRTQNQLTSGTMTPSN